MRRPRFEQVVDAGGTVITVAWAGFLGVGLAVAAVGGFAWVITQLTGSTAVLSEVGSPTLDASSSVSDISVPNALAAFWLLVAAAVLLGLAYAASRAIEGLADSPG